jgi:lipopolysaccharide export system permease protein
MFFGKLHRYLAREILLPFAAGVVFLTQILIATSILAQAGVLFGSGVSFLDVARVSLDLVPHYLGYVLPVSFLLGAVVGAGRLADDREIVAMGAAGLSPVRLVPVPVLLGIAAAGAALVLALAVEPRALHDARLRVNDIIRRNITNDVKGGVFYEELPGLTLYAESVHEGRWSRVLISAHEDPQTPLLALAQSGRLEPAAAESELRLVLRDGEVHREQLGPEEYFLAQYRRATVTLGVAETLQEQNRIGGALFELTVSQIADRARAAAAAGDAEGRRRWETFLHRRIAAPLSLLAFSLVAVPVAATRRGGRAFGYAATLLSVVAYYALMRFGEGLSQKGSLPPWLGPQLGNIAFALLGAGLSALLGRRGAEAVR